MAIRTQQADLPRIGIRVLGVDRHRHSLLEHAKRLRITADVERGLGFLDPGLRGEPEGDDKLIGPIPVGDDAFVDGHRRHEVASHQVGDLARVEAARELAAHVEQAAQLAGEGLAASEQARRLEGRRRLVGKDEQQSLVVVVELAQPELRERDDADDDTVVGHRNHEHRLVDVVRSRDRGPTGVRVGVGDEERLAVLRDPPGEAVAETRPEQAQVDLLVLADPALEGDRDDVAARLEQIDPRVVIVDDPASLLDDRPADLGDPAGPAEPRGRGLEHGQLGRPQLRPREELAVLQGDRGVRSEGGDEVDVAARPVSRLDRHRGQRADDAAGSHERDDDVAAELVDARVTRIHRAELGCSNVVDDPWSAGPDELAEPALERPEHGQDGGRGIVQAGPGDDLESIVAEQPQHGRVGIQAEGCLVDDSAEELRAVVGLGEPLGDVEDPGKSVGQDGAGAPAWRCLVRSGRPSRGRTAARRRGRDGISRDGILATGSHYCRDRRTQVMAVRPTRRTGRTARMYLPKSADPLTIAGVVVHVVARLTDRVVASSIARAELDLVALGLPGRQSARDPRHVAEARPSEQRGGHARAIAARAHHHDGAVARQVVEPVQE